nr:unnamed protein product [Callosobruchus analis]
MQYTFCQRP